MPVTAVAVDLDEALQVGGDLPAELALYLVFLRDIGVKQTHLVLGEVFHPDLRVDLGLEAFKYFFGHRAPDAENIGEGDADLLLSG